MLLPTGFLESPYDACTSFQTRSADLVIFSPSVGEHVTLAWPMYHGRRIQPHRIKEWLRTRGLHWPCFCSLTLGTGGSRSTRIVEALSGSVHAFCNDHAMVCGFRMNLTRVYETATFESEYAHLPILSTGAPNMAGLRDQFRSAGFTLPGPYFLGYCGEHESEYQQVTQLAGNSLGRSMWNSSDAHARRRARLDERATVLPPLPTSLAYTRIRGRRRNAIAGPSGVQPGAPSVREQDIINRFQAGEGVSETELANLFEKCFLCDHYFVATLRQVHIRGCIPDSD